MQTPTGDPGDFYIAQCAESRTSELTVKIYRAHIIEKTRPDSLAHVARMAEKLKTIVRE